MWNFQCQPLFFEFSKESKGPPSRYFWCPISHAHFQFQPQLWGIVLWKLRIIWLHPTWSAEVHGSFLCSVFKALSKLPESAWLLQRIPGNIRELMCLKSSSTNRGWELVDKFCCPLSFRWALCIYLWSSQRNPAPLADGWNPNYATLFGLFSSCLCFPSFSLPSVTRDCLQNKLPILVFSEARLSGAQTVFLAYKTLKSGS